MKFVEINYLLFLLGIENDTRKVCEFFSPGRVSFSIPIFFCEFREIKEIRDIKEAL
jgi:hypothetical protein